MSLRRQPFAIRFVLIALAVTPLNGAEERRSIKTDESEARLKRDVFYLASDECEGRGPTTAGLKKAGDYIAEEFKKAGLKPGNPDGTFFQDFTINASFLEAPATLALTASGQKEHELKQGVDFYPMGFGTAGKVTDASLVFAGYGMTTAPKNKDDKTPDYDDYAGLDVSGKVVVLLRDVPRTADTKAIPAGSIFRQHGSLARKLSRAVEHEAAAVIFVNDADTVRTGDDLLDFNYTAVGSQRPFRMVDKKAVDVQLPVFHMKREVLERMLKSTGASLARIESAIDKELEPHSIPLKGWTVSLEVKMKRDKLHLRNVIGVLDGKGPLANETVIVGAHYDHLGYGGAGGSRSGLKKMAIHHGADDNGSGSTAVMELARRLADQPNRAGRRILFMTFSGEELGLLGSAYYAKNPLYPLKDTTFMLNLDMVGRLKHAKDSQRDQLLTEGSGTDKGFAKLLGEWNKKYDFDLKKTPGASPFSDHFSFYEKKVPVLFFWTGFHDDYHRTTDTADKINVPGMRRVVELSEEVVRYFATVPERPVWQEVKGSGAGRPGRNGPTLGFTPEFGGEDGVGVSSVRDGSPGDKAGLKAGDKIVEITGKPILTLTGYTEVMATFKAGDKIDVVVIRDGKKATLKVKLE